MQLACGDLANEYKRPPLPISPLEWSHEVEEVHIRYSRCGAAYSNSDSGGRDHLHVAERAHRLCAH